MEPTTDEPPREWLALLKSGRLEDIAELSLSVRASSSPDAREALAREMPTSLAGLPAEASFALSELAMDLSCHELAIADDVLQLAPQLRIAWVRVYLCAGRSLTDLDDSLLLAMAHGWGMTRLTDAEPLARRLSESDDPRLRAELLKILAPLLNETRLSAEVAFELVLTLATDENATLRKRALRSMALCQFATLRPARRRAREVALQAALSDADAGVADAAIGAMSVLSLTDAIRGALADPETPVCILPRLLEALGHSSTRDDLDPVFALIRQHPYALAEAFGAFLLSSHRHGVFVRVDHLGELLSLFDRASMSADDLVMLTYIHREELVARVAKTPDDDSRWRRRAKLLALSHGTKAHLVLADLLMRVTDLRLGEALLDAAARSDAYNDERALLGWLRRLPTSTLRALSAKGGALACDELLPWALDPLRERSHRRAAIDLLMRLSSERTQLKKQLAEALGPRESQLLTARPARDKSTANLVATKPWPEVFDTRIDADAKMRVLCGAGHAYRDEVVACFREIFASFVREGTAGDFTAKRMKIPALEQRLYKYGQRLVADGRRARSFVSDAPETGRDLVLSVLVDWLNERPTQPITVALLEALARHVPSGASLHAVLPFYRSKIATVARAAMEAILASGDAGRGLELSICRIAGESKVDPRVLERALLSVAAFEAHWAEPLARHALEHSNMSVKKAAASALAIVANPLSIKRLVFWLGRHDNPGLRSRLMSALKSAAGDATASVLITAIDEANDAREVGLLHDALSGTLTLAHVLTLAERRGPTHDAIVDEALADRIKLKDAKAMDLAERLHRRALRVASKEKDDPMRALRLFGFSPERAEKLIAIRDQDETENVLPVIRAQFASWLSWVSSDAAALRNVRYLADAADRQHCEHLDRLFEVFVRAGSDLPVGSLLSFLKKMGCALFNIEHRRRAIALLRALPPREDASEVERFRLLKTLGAVRTRDDLKRSLEGARRSPTFTRDAQTLLTEALQVPPARDGDREELAALRGWVAGWAQEEEGARQRWLEHVLKSRPIDVAMVDPVEVRKAPTASTRESQLKSLREGDAREREEAARALLESRDPAAAREVLGVYLAERVDVTAGLQPVLVEVLVTWPKDPAEQARASTLSLYASEAQRASWVPTWAKACLAGDATSGRLVHTAHNAGLVHAFVLDEIAAGRPEALHLLRADGSIAQRELIARYQETQPYLVAHLLVEEREEVQELSDPLEGLDQAELAALIQGRATKVGVAVRALHALASEETVTLFAEFAIDPRPSVRSAALRKLRQYADRDVSLRATLDALQIESRKDVTVRLMRSLAHARYERALAPLLARLSHRDPMTRAGAHDALVTWGASAERAIERARRKARPDKRPAFDALLAEIRYA